MNRPRCHEGATTMAERFTAYRIHQRDGGVAARYEVLSLDDLSPGNVVVAVGHSGVNYKDALAATGAGKILRRFPLVGGIDLAGRVVVSDDPRFRPGDEVLATGCGLSETHDGGYAEVARLPGDWLVPLPPAFDGHDAMALGTAGFTAALAIHRLEQNGLEPGGGPVAVTGASGGVGSLAIDILAARGHHVVAVTGKDTVTDHLRSLGAVDPSARGDRGRRQAAREVAIRRRHRQRRRRDGGMVDAHGRSGRIDRGRRDDGWHRPPHHGDAVHHPRGEPARDRLRPDAAGDAPHGLAAPRG